MQCHTDSAVRAVVGGVANTALSQGLHVRRCQRSVGRTRTTRLACAGARDVPAVIRRAV